MALSIKTDEADRLARELAAATHETLTEAVTVALRERLERVAASAATDPTDRADRLTAEYRRHRVRDRRPPEELIGYDEDGVPA